METAEEDSPSKDTSPNIAKRPHLADETSKTPPTKKVRLSFSAKDFRKQLKSEQRTQVLQRFLQLIDEDSNQQCIITYLEQGGSPLEVLQLMEGESGVSPVLVFDVVNRILLRVAGVGPYQNAAHSACRYILNTYLAQVNKMLGLGSSMKERTVTLKLLTTIVTYSVLLAKDVLLNVNFNPTNLELLTKNEGKNDARIAFIYFITAFLVDGHFPAFSVLLEKRGLMTSIISGLQFDQAEIVVLVLTAMKNHILENVAVSKTVKMKTFNTGVVRNIVNLYNWKGPAGVGDPKKKTKIVTVDETIKCKVNEAVHSFLLVLCTSHKYGVIFRDPLLGLGSQQNTLMMTVLKSLERPWEHSYAGELVIKICWSCPDLAKIMWLDLKTFLEPRWTTKWLKAVQFAEGFVGGLKPEFIEFGVGSLSVRQIAQVLTFLISPLPVVKTLIPENYTFDQFATKYHVISLFLKMANCMEIFLERFRTNVDHGGVKAAIANHIQRNFPGIDRILTGWDQADEEVSTSDYLKVAFDLLAKYKTLAPEIVQTDVNFEIGEFYSKCEDPDLQVKAVDFFLDLVPESFKPKTELFRSVLVSSLAQYHLSRDVKVLEVVRRLLKNCSVFDGFFPEIDFWVDGILNLKNYDEGIAGLLCDLIRESEDHAAEYHKRLFDLQGANFSTMVLSLDKEAELTKNAKNYLSFVVVGICHVQENLDALETITSNFSFLSENLKNYISSWKDLEVAVLPKSKGRLMEQLHQFSHGFLENSVENSDFSLYPNNKLNSLQSLVFYLTNLVQTGGLKDHHKTNCLKFLDQNTFDDRCLRTIFSNRALLQNFTINIDDFTTKFVLQVIKNQNRETIEVYLGDFRRKLVSSLLKLFKKSESQSEVCIDVLETLSLEYNQCQKLLTKLSTSPSAKNFYQVACYCLNRITELGRNHTLEPLPDVSLFSRLMIDQVPNIHLLSSSLLNYLRLFPHNLADIGPEVFSTLLSLTEFHKDNLSLCEFLYDRNPDCRASFETNLDEICTKRSFILTLLDVVIRHQNDSTLEHIYNKIEPHIIKALQKPHKAGQHFQNRYRSVGLLIEKFMKPDKFESQIQKFETAELFHVYLLKKIFDKVEKTDKIFSNMIMTFVHLLSNLLKQKNAENLTEIGEIVLEFLRENKKEVVFLSNNETLKTFCKLCLKYGIGDGVFVLIRILTEVVDVCLEESEAGLILEMMLSHSQFMDVFLGDSQKDDLVNLWKVICDKWPGFMERNHVPVLLAAYKATNGDSTTLSLLKMYESHHTQTKFFDFKPFLWGRAAASHYSVRSDFQRGLWRQPKMADVLNNLHHGTIVSTITDPSHPNSYDLDYFLPLFSHLLSPENPVQTYRFTRSGALALALTGFRGDKTQRFATCHVLQRFYFHLEARQSGKDNLLWLRFVEAICKGIAVFEDYKINNFVGVFLARMALVMTNPMDVMFVPLSQYLGAKDVLDFSTIPELYTFLHSPHVESQQHKHFILEVLRDGLKTEKDFTTLLKSMGFKLISELCSSTVCDLRSKILILEVFEECCKFELGVKVLCGSLAFLSQMYSLVLKNLTEGVVLAKLLGVLLKIVQVDTNRHRNFIVYLNLMTLVKNEQHFRCLVESKSLGDYYRALMLIVDRFPEFLTVDHMDALLRNSEDKLCAYLVRFSCNYVKETDLIEDTEQHYLRLLIYRKLQR